MIAFVVLRAGAEASEADILAFCGERLAKYKTPKQVIFTGSLPKSGVGKVMRRELRDSLPV